MQRVEDLEELVGQMSIEIFEKDHEISMYYKRKSGAPKTIMSGSASPIIEELKRLRLDQLWKEIQDKRFEI